MNLFESILDEAIADRTLELGAAVAITLAVTRALVPRADRRTRAMLVMYLGHAALIPVAGWLRWSAGTTAQGALAAAAAHGAGMASGVRFGALLLAAMTTIAAAGQLAFDVVLPRLRLPVPRILRDLITAAASIVAVFAVATRLGFNLSGIIATSAVVTAVVGFSLQDTLGNVMGGLALQLDNSIAVGDWVKVGDVSGRVTEIRWRYTAVETRNWETVIFPNSVLMKGQVTVAGRRAGQPPYWRRWVYFAVDTNHPPPRVIGAVVDALRAAPLDHVAAAPPPQCILVDFGDTGCRYAVRYWLTDLAVDDPTDAAVRTRVYFALKRLGAPIAAPTRHVYMHDASHSHTEAEREREMARRLRVLARLDLFRELADDERAAIARALQYAPFATGEALTRQGNVAHWLYILAAGEVAILVAVDGVEREVSRVHAPTIVGEMGLLTGDPRAATVIAASEIECYRLDKEAFQAVLHARPTLARTVANLLSRRKVELEAVKEGLSAEAKEKRVTESSAQTLGRILDFFGLA